MAFCKVYGDPLEHPQQEKYWGNVNCIGERSCYDEGKRAAECLTFDYLREHNLEVVFFIGPSPIEVQWLRILFLLLCKRVKVYPQVHS